MKLSCLASVVTLKQATPTHNIELLDFFACVAASETRGIQGCSKIISVCVVTRGRLRGAISRSVFEPSLLSRAFNALENIVRMTREIFKERLIVMKLLQDEVGHICGTKWVIIEILKCLLNDATTLGM
jgi:hypothetical protein